MPSTIGQIRSALLGIRSQGLTLNRPGNSAPKTPAADEFERVFLHVKNSIDMAVRSKNNNEVIAAIEGMPAQYRAFAFEGAATGVAIIDSITPFSRRVNDLITGAASRYNLTMYAGVGLAMGRIPKRRWPKIFPEHRDSRWAALDGYGFHNAFFHTEKWIGDHVIDDSLPSWMGEPGPLNRVIDQGVGRALWFISGGSPDQVADTIQGFDPARHGDLWDGIGLAATFAGGVETDTLKALLARVPQFRQRLAAGACVAAKIREQADETTPHTQSAVLAYTGRTVAQAAALYDQALIEVSLDGTAASYVAWRDRLGVLATPSVNPVAQTSGTEEAG